MSSSQLLTAFVFIMRYNILPDIYQEQWKDKEKKNMKNKTAMRPAALEFLSDFNSNFISPCLLAYPCTNLRWSIW